MKKWLVCVFLLVFLTGCRVDPDMILKGDEISVIAEEDMCSRTEAEPEMQEQKDNDSSGIYVYICGAVKNPGVYELEKGSRVYQLVDAAGGLNEDADDRSVNLAETITDGQMVRILSVTEAEGGSEQEFANYASGITTDGKVNINTASEEELMSLSGIGQTKADGIIAYREEHGAFRNTEEIMQVSGIGESTYEKIKKDITVQ